MYAQHLTCYACIEPFIWSDVRTQVRILKCFYNQHHSYATVSFYT